MKNSRFRLVLLLISFSCIFGMCSKKDAGTGNPPLFNQLAKGFLVTIGKNSIYNMDTICFRNSTSGSSYSVTDYSWNAFAGDFLKEKDKWEAISTGTNQWHFKNNGGRYLGYEYNASPIDPINKYTVSLDETPGEKNLFTINQTDNKFYIQPVANTNVYLNTIPFNVQPADPRHQGMRFLESQKQMWWFMAN